ncbi:MAG: hypothetical protein HUJ68_11220 [Clostridia bacterium]|nr:hypothetical protein [Clostridia bacterium]
MSKYEVKIGVIDEDYYNAFISSYEQENKDKILNPKFDKSEFGGRPYVMFVDKRTNVPYSDKNGIPVAFPLRSYHEKKIKINDYETTKLERHNKQIEKFGIDKVPDYYLMDDVNSNDVIGIVSCGQAISCPLCCFKQRKSKSRHDVMKINNTKKSLSKDDRGDHITKIYRNIQKRFKNLPIHQHSIDPILKISINKDHYKDLASKYQNNFNKVLIKSVIDEGKYPEVLKTIPFVLDEKLNFYKKENQYVIFAYKQCGVNSIGYKAYDIILRKVSEINSEKPDDIFLKNTYFNSDLQLVHDEKKTQGIKGVEGIENDL